MHIALYGTIYFPFPFTNQKKAFLFFLPSLFHLYLKIYGVFFFLLFPFYLQSKQRLFFFRSLGYLLLDNQIRDCKRFREKNRITDKTKNQFFKVELKHILCLECWYTLVQTEILINMEQGGLLNWSGLHTETKRFGHYRQTKGKSQRLKLSFIMCHSH